MVDNSRLKVFLSYASQDGPAVQELYTALRTETWIDPWVDRAKILPGADWRLVIEKAVEEADVVIVCLSTQSLTKEGFVQQELRYATRIAEEKPEQTVFLIPLRLDNCIIPRWFRHIQWIDYFGAEKINAYSSLLTVLRLRYKQISGNETTQYDLDVVNDMLRELADKQLRTLVYERLPSLFSTINWNSYSFKIISDIVLFAQRQNRVSEIIDWTNKNTPHIYSKYLSSLELASSVITGDADNIGNETIIDNQRIYKLPRNPYVTGNPVQPTNSRVFLGRLDIAEAIVHEIRRSRQKPSFLLYGRRRMGKTSTLLNLRRLIRDIKIVDVLISGQNSKFHSDKDFCFHIAQKIIKATKESLFITDEFMQKYSGQSYYNDSPSLALSIFFDEYHELLEQNDLYCLLMLDEYEEFGNLSRELLLQLRDTLQHLHRFIFIFSGISHTNELPSPFWSEVFINVRNLKISFLERSDGYKLLTEPAPELLYENPRLINKILDVTACQPFLLQAIAAELLNDLTLSNKTAVSNDDLNLAIRRIFSIWQNYFQGYIWTKECSTDIHKEIVTKVAREKVVRVSKLNRYHVQIDDLVEKDILKKQDDNLLLTMPIIQTWLNKDIKPSWMDLLLNRK